MSNTATQVCPCVFFWQVLKYKRDFQQLLTIVDGKRAVSTIAACPPTVSTAATGSTNVVPSTAAPVIVADA
jgi:hypothetical protein